MQADVLAVMALMAGFICMVAVGVWVRLDDETQTEIGRAKGRLIAGAGAAAGLLYLLAEA